jgi:hypothetical protein
MNIRAIAAATAAFGILASASVANAAITVNTSAGYPVENDLFGSTLAANGQTMLWDFDGIAASTVDFTGMVWQGPQTGGASASPPFNGDPAGDTTKYASVAANQTSTFSAINGNVLTSFSFYMGSPDAYNKLTFNLADGTSQVFNGNEIWGGTPQNPGGDRTLGYRVYYDFGGALVNSITFESVGADAFEFDGLAGTAVPEPGTWALMILGFGGAGAMIRRRKMAVA